MRYESAAIEAITDTCFFGFKSKSEKMRLPAITARIIRRKSLARFFIVNSIRFRVNESLYYFPIDKIKQQKIVKQQVKFAF